MKNAFITLLFALMPIQVLAAEKPSMSALWIELCLIIIVLIVLKIAHFSNQNKFIIFISYVLSGILTQTIWVPVILFIVLFYVFNQNTD